MTLPAYRPTLHARARPRPGVTVKVQWREWAQDWCAVVEFADRDGCSYRSCHGASSPNRAVAIVNAIRGARAATRAGAKR